ncbi:MAG: type II secretion system F family protein [Alphaproteobacteria bacterium]|nr:type II secretion system F family protein [Alphaproteobacteria bacterium]
MLLVAVMLLMREFASDRMERRVLATVGMEAVARSAATAPLGAFGRVLQRLGGRIRSKSSLYSEEDLLALETVVAASGLNANRVLPMVLGAKMVLTFLIPAIAVIYGLVAGLTGMQFLLLVSLTVPIGLLGPDWILHFVRKPYVAALRRGLPDALDLLVICTESGMGLELALEQVAREIAVSNKAISVALSKLLDELRVLPDRRDAFDNFGRRSGIDGFRRLAAMLGQTLQYGTPVAEALRSVAADLRRDRMVQLEAKCTKLPALLVLPLIIFIMPALFVVLAASPILRVLDTLRLMATGHQ